MPDDLKPPGEGPEPEALPPQEDPAPPGEVAEPLEALPAQQDPEPVGEAMVAEPLEVLSTPDDLEPSAGGPATGQPEALPKLDPPEPPGEGPEPEALAAQQEPDSEPEPSAEGLTREQFEALLALLHPDRQRAAEIYEEIRGRLIRMFELRHCDCPEDLADETLDRVGRRRAEGAPIHNSLAYTYGVAHRVFKEILRREERKRQAMEAKPPPDPTWSDPREDERLDCLRRCLARLPEDQRLLIVRYHDEDDRIHSRRELAKELGIAMNALRIRVHRIRRDLTESVRSCLAKRR